MNNEVPTAHSTNYLLNAVRNKSRCNSQMFLFDKNAFASSHRSQEQDVRKIQLDYYTIASHKKRKIWYIRSNGGRPKYHIPTYPTEFPSNYEIRRRKVVRTHRYAWKENQTIKHFQNIKKYKQPRELVKQCFFFPFPFFSLLALPIKT